MTTTKPPQMRMKEQGDLLRHNDGTGQLGEIKEPPKAALEALKNCPFCGGQPELFKVSLHGWHVACVEGNTICVSLKYRATKEEAIQAWNTRRPSPTVDTKAILEGVLEEYVQRTKDAYNLPDVTDDGGYIRLQAIIQQQLEKLNLVG